MLLCQRCRDMRDWRDDPVVQNRVRLNLEKPDEAKARCGDCFRPIRNPMFRLHRKCARKAGLCQHCSSEVTDTDLARDAAE